MNIGDDPEVQKYCEDRLRFRLEHTAKRLNAAMGAIRERWPDATARELYIAYDLCDGSLDDLLESLESPAFCEKVRLEARRPRDSSSPEPLRTVQVEEEGDDSDDGDFVYTVTYDEPGPKGRYTRKRGPPTPCSLACPPEIREDVWATWSAARKTSWFQAQERPQAYYYRHLPPGEVQKSGPWSTEEKRLFVTRMNELRGKGTTFNGCWGTFSLAIPGRVGYQCSNYYRIMLATGEMTDSQYFRGPDGNLHHVSRAKSWDKKLKVKGVEKASKETEPERPPARERRREPKRGKRVKFEPLRVDDIESLRLVRRLASPLVESVMDEPQMSRYDMWAMQNPLPETTDLITGELIKVPAMSPDGYVLDYRTWLETLLEKPVNPFTGNHVTKRQLVVLTTENFPEYADKIVNLTER
jgi:hypothetical protein